MQYTVKQGDHLSKIAFEHGFIGTQTIWLHPENKSLRDRRRNPHVLYPGDTLHLPQREQRSEQAATETRHRFKVTSAPLKLRLVLRDATFAPIADRKCTLIVDGLERELVSKADGLIEAELPPTASEAKLVVRGETAVDIVLLIGHLDPVDTLSGQKARLNNLGYFAGTLAEDDEALFESAVEEFQLEQMGAAAVDGKCGPKTQDKLKQVHGC